MGLRRNYILRLSLMLLSASACHAAKASDGTTAFPADTVKAISQTAEAVPDTASVFLADTVTKAEGLLTAEQSRQMSLSADTLAKRKKRDWATWRPNAKRAMWLAIVLPGAGQIYNRKFWKIPIVYGGFVGCAYAMRWNNQMYRDYSQAYLDIMDDDPNTQSYNQFLHLGAEITEANMERYKTLFKKRKDRYRRWRDMSFFCLVAVYALSVIDAYVDASLSEFDISDDLSFRVEPAIINGSTSQQNAGNPFKTNALGLNCSLRF